jgi:hypothetical protein
VIFSVLVQELPNEKNTGVGGFAIGVGMHPRKFNSAYRLAFKVSTVFSSGE